MMHQISKFLFEYNCFFTPYYCDGFLRLLQKSGLTEFTVIGKEFREKAIEYIICNNLNLDIEGKNNEYDLVITCSDLVIQQNIKAKKIILIQEGMTDPENFMYSLVKLFRLPRYLASTSTTGLSHCYEAFCVASEGYKDLFISKGVESGKIIVTGIPNFDNAEQYLDNDFPYKNYVLAATSDARETLKLENRKRFIRKCIEIADGRFLIFKLHPNENKKRAVREIKEFSPNSIIFTSGNTSHMIANCEALITKYSSVVYTGLALGKEVYSDFDINMLKKLLPLQNRGKSAENIAEVCISILEEGFVNSAIKKYGFENHFNKQLISFESVV